MNHVKLFGKLSREPHVRYTKTGRVVTAFRMEVFETFVDENGEEKQIKDFVSCSAWDRLGEFVGNLHEGDSCFVVGRISTRSYEKQDGNMQYETEVSATFIGRDLLKNVR